jgi:hypothetical protein
VHRTLTQHCALDNGGLAVSQIDGVAVLTRDLRDNAVLAELKLSLSASPALAQAAAQQ